MLAQSWHKNCAIFIHLWGKLGADLEQLCRKIDFFWLQWGKNGFFGNNNGAKLGFLETVVAKSWRRAGIIMVQFLRRAGSIMAQNWLFWRNIYGKLT